MTLHKLNCTHSAPLEFDGELLATSAWSGVRRENNGRLTLTFQLFRAENRSLIAFAEAVNTMNSAGGGKEVIVQSEARIVTDASSALAFFERHNPHAVQNAGPVFKIDGTAGEIMRLMSACLHGADLYDKVA